MNDKIILVIFAVLLLLGIRFILWLISKFKKRKIDNKIIKKDTPYNFDFKKERKIYNKIGVVHAKKNLGDDFCETYSVWKAKFCNKYLEPDVDEKEKYTYINNFKRYLNSYYRLEQTSNMVNTYVLIPVLISIITIIWQAIDGSYKMIEDFNINIAIKNGIEKIEEAQGYMFNERWFTFLILIIPIIITGLIELYAGKSHVEFYEDCVGVCDEVLKEKEES